MREFDIYYWDDLLLCAVVNKSFLLCSVTDLEIYRASDMFGF
jgi:ribosomal 30S subunit maturation factor RimM